MKAKLTKLAHALFKLIHFQHFNQQWNGKPRYKLVRILGFRTALVDNVAQRERVELFWKIGKYHLPIIKYQ